MYRSSQSAQNPFSVEKPSTHQETNSTNPAPDPDPPGHPNTSPKDDAPKSPGHVDSTNPAPDPDPPGYRPNATPPTSESK